MKKIVYVSCILKWGAISLCVALPLIEAGYWIIIRKISRKIDRSFKATNPDNYDKKGRAKKNVKWMVSNQCRKDLDTRRELLRQQSAARKTAHGELANSILEMGTLIKTEQLSYKSFQRNHREIF